MDAIAEKLRSLAERIRALKPWQLAAIDDEDDWPTVLETAATIVEEQVND